MPQNKKNQSTALTALRAGIDAIDDELIALLIKRCEIVRQVADYKKAYEPEMHNIRPGREAEMLRRIMEKCEGTAFMPAAAAAVWRLIIGASTAIETPLSFTAYAPENEMRYFWLTREYFGGFLPCQKQPTINRVIGDVTDGKSSVGILPVPTAEPNDNWWMSLARSNKNWPKIFAMLPFVPGDKRDVGAALAIGLVTPEPTGDDMSYVVVQVDDTVSTSRLHTSFNKHGLEANWINIQSANNKRFHLVEVAGFVQDDDPRFAPMIEDIGSAITQTYVLGNYARPFNPKR